MLLFFVEYLLHIFNSYTKVSLWHSFLLRHKAGIQNMLSGGSCLCDISTIILLNRYFETILMLNAVILVFWMQNADLTWRYDLLYQICLTIDRMSLWLWKIKM